MNEQLLKDLVATAQADRYDWDVILGKFPEFEGVAPQVLKDYVATAEADKYNYKKVNKKFPEFSKDETTDDFDDEEEVETVEVDGEQKPKLYPWNGSGNQKANENGGNFLANFKKDEDGNTYNSSPQQQTLDDDGEPVDDTAGLTEEEEKLISPEEAARYREIEADKKVAKEKEAYLKTPKGKVEEFNKLSKEEQQQRAELYDFLDPEGYRQFLMGAKVTEDQDKKTVLKEDYTDPTTTDVLLSKDNNLVDRTTLTTEEMATENALRKEKDLEWFLKNKNSGQLITKKQAAWEGTQAITGEVGDFLGFLWDAAVWDFDGMDEYSPGETARKRASNYTQGQQDAFKVWQNEYSTRGSISNSTTIQDYFKKKLLAGEIYDNGKQLTVEGDFDPDAEYHMGTPANDMSEYIYGKHVSYLELVRPEYEALRNKAIKGKNQKDIKKLFGVDISSEDLKNHTIKSLSEYLGVPDADLSLDNVEEEVESDSILDTGGIGKQDIDTIFKETALGSDKDFRNWLNSDSGLQGRMKEIYREGEDGTSRVKEAFKAEVMNKYFLHKQQRIANDYRVFENRGINGLLSGFVSINEDAEKITENYNSALANLNKIKSGFKDGTIKKTKENIDAHNVIIKEIEGYSTEYDQVIAAQEELMTPNNQALLDSFLELQDENQEIKKMRTSFLKNTEYGRQFKKKSDLQEMANKGDRWFQEGAGAGDLVSTIVNWIPQTISGLGVTGLAGVESITPDSWVSEEDVMDFRAASNLVLEDFQIVNNQTSMIDPITGEWNLNRLLPNVGSTVLDMGLMIYTGGRSYAVAKTAGRYARTKLARIVPGQTLKNATPLVKKAASMASTAAGSLPVLFPSKLDEAMAQISEEFSAEDAYEYAQYTTAAEALIEVINPDWKWTKLNVAKIKKSLNKGESVLNALLNAKKLAFKQSLKAVPAELLEEFTQNFTNGQINEVYNANFDTDFVIPGADSYKETAVLTALSVLTMRGLSGNLTKMDKTSIYRVASENFPAFEATLDKNLADGKITPEQRLEYLKAVKDYTLVSGEINDLIWDEDGNTIMTIEQQDRMIGKIMQRNQLQAQITENPDSALNKDLKKELDAINESISNERNIIKSENSQSAVTFNELRIKALEVKIKDPETSKELKKQLRQQVGNIRKENKKLKAAAPEYSLAGKTYKNKAKFLKALKTAKWWMRDPKKRKNLNIKIKDDLGTEKEVSKILGKYAPKEVKNRVVMTQKDAADAETFIDNRTELELRSELKKETDKAKGKTNKNKIQEYRDALKYLELKKANYKFGKPGFLVEPIITNRQELADLQLEGNIAAVQQATDSYGGELEVLTNDQAIAKYGMQADGANGFFAPKYDKKGKIIGFVKVVNTDVSRETGAGSVASHEMLHDITYSLINGPRRKVVDPQGKVVWVKVSKEGVELINGFLDIIGKENKEVLDRKLDEGQYKFNEYKNGIGVPGTEKAVEQYIEEYLEAYHDAVVIDKSINHKPGIVQRIINFWNNLINKAAPGIAGINIQNSQELYEFLGSYNKQTVEQRFNDQVVEMGKNSIQDRKDFALADLKNKAYQKSLKNDKEGLVLSKSKPLDLESKADLFSKTNEELSMALQAYGLEGEFDSNNEDHLDIWNSIPKQDKLFIGYSIGSLWRNHAKSKLFIQYGNTPNFNDHQSDILDVLTTGIEVGQNGLPYIVSTWDPTQRKLTSHIWDLLPTRIPHVTRLPQFAGFGKSIDETFDNEVNQNIDDTPTKTNVLKFDKVRDVVSKIRNIVKVKKGDTFKEISDKFTGKVAQVVFGVPQDKITDPKKNLTYAKKIVKGIPEASEAGNIQDFYRVGTNAEKLIKILPKQSVSSQDADINELGENIEVSRDVYGRGLGLSNRMLNYFYNKTDSRSKGKTSQPFIWELKPEFRNPSQETINKLKEDLGITPKGELNNYDRNIGQLLKGAAKFQAQQTALSTAQRILEPTIAEVKQDQASEVKQQLADIRSGQSSLAFSRTKKALSEVDVMLSVYSEFDLGINGKDILLNDNKLGSTLKIKKVEDIKDYIDMLKSDVFPMLPKEAFFGPGKGTAFTSTSAIFGLTSLKDTNGDTIKVKDPKSGKMKSVPDPLWVEIQSEIQKLKNDETIVYGDPIPGVDASQMWSLRNKYSTLFTSPDVIKSKKKEILEFNDQVGKIHKEMWVRIHAAVAQDKNKAIGIATYLGIVANDTGHWHKMGAQFAGYSTEITKREKGKSRYEFEHAMPATAAYLYLLQSALNPSINFEVAYELIVDNYKLIALDKAMDDKLVNAKTESGYSLQRRMPDNWSPLQDNWYERYFNGIVEGIENGIDPNSIVDLDGVTFADKFGLKPVITKPGIKNNKRLGDAIVASRSVKPAKGITVLDFDDTLATSNSLIRYTKPDGTKGTLNAEQYASTYQELTKLGYKWDFSEFAEVVDGKIAPLFQKALKLQGKFGPDNMFVLTARPAEAAPAIFAFLQANGLNIPLKNITGLANSTAEAKALWMADKVTEGYNDFYFADDALQNVKAVDNMLEQFDVKRKVQQAKLQFSKSMNKSFNDILENVTDIASDKRFSDIKARKRGAEKGKFRVFIPPSHEDFVGLLYNFMGKGKEGNKHRDFFETALVKPLNRAYKEIDAAKQAIANDFKNLNKQFPEVKDRLIKDVPGGDFTYQDAIRVYLWNKHGHKIPGLTATDQQNLVDLVMQDPKLRAYAENLNIISKQATYVDPGPNWNTGNIRIDLVDATGRVGRKVYFTEFNENAEVLFSEENLNKIEAAYGSNFRSALEDMLHRIKTGVNRPKGASAKPNIFMNWLNASVAGVMFFNTRSALLQQMSNVNYLNFADNNIYAAGKAFANQKQYWKDFAMIFNSDMMKQRRGGLQTDINGAELAEAIKKARPGNVFDQVAIITGKALKLGFLPTQIGDNIAIATGGAAFYRNRVNKYIKDGMSVKDAETAAFTDFQNITQSTQQSARPDMTSQQQASWIGKLVLNFLNTPSQYNRIIKKAGSDMLNRRITPPNTTQIQSDMSNMSRILYYGAVQNLIFYSLQTALFAVAFGGEDDDDKAEQFLKKKERVINGTIDTILRGSGIYGVAISTLKNMTIKFLEQREKGYNKDESAVLMEALNFSPVIGIKARRIVNAEKTLNYNGKVIDEMETFDIDNPVWSAVTNLVQATTGAPVNKILSKVTNLRNAMDAKYTAFQRVLFLSGYTTWSLGLGDTDKMIEIKEKVKEKSKAESKERAKIKKEEKKKEVAIENVAVIEENKKKSKKDGVCSAISKGGKRCKSKAINGGFCTVHEKTVERSDGKKVQCRKRKSDNKRCGMKTTNKSGYCYYHD